MDKVTPDLASRIEVTDDECLVDVVVELEAPPVPSAVPSGDRAAAIAELKETFRAAADPVIRLVVALGGEVLGEAWLNRTLRVRVPASAIAELSAASGVSAVDIPRRIEAEAG